MKKNIEIYEDNGGGLHLCILDEDGDCIAIYGNWEYTEEPGILLDAYDQMHDDPDAYLSWDGNELDYIDDEDLTVEDLYNEFEYRDLIAWTDEAGELQTKEWDKIGYAGCKALGLKEETVIKYEIWTDRFEIRIGRTEDARTMTEREVFDEYLAEDANNPHLAGTFDTQEEAEEHFKRYFANYGTSRAVRGTAGWLLVGQVAYLQADEYDEDGEYIQGGDILMTSSEAYEATI